MTEADLVAADELRRLAGWNQTLEDWRRLLAFGLDGCFAAVSGNEVIGTVTTTCYGSALAWIGMMLVHPDHRGQGVGRALMCGALDHLETQGVKCIKLDATPAGRPLYEKLGFMPESALTRSVQPGQGMNATPTKAPVSFRVLRDENWGAIDNLDSTSFGVSRLELLRSLTEGSRRALVWPEVGEVRAWGLLRPGAEADYLGPAVCSSEGAQRLIEGLLEAAESRPVIWDVPEGSQTAQTTARRLGFVAQRPLTRMRLGPALTSEREADLLAIADPALG